MPFDSGLWTLDAGLTFEIPMNKQQLEQYWEACRDGSIGDADRIAFEAYLHAHPKAAAMWKAESQWLQMLADVDGAFEEEAGDMTAGSRPSVSGEAFVAGVLEQWQATQEQEQLGVVATIGPSSALASLTDASSASSSSSHRRPVVRYLAMFTGLAAAVALLTLAAIYGNFLGNDTGTGTPPGDIVVVPPGTVPNVTPPLTGTTQPDAQPLETPDALGLLFASAKNNYALAAASPSRIKQGFANTAAFLDVGNLASLLDPGLPDPADFVEQ